MMDLSRITKEHLRLIEPCKEYFDSYLKSAEDSKKYSPEAEQFVREVPEFIEYAKKSSLGIDLPEGFVPETFLWLVNDKEFIGQVAIRHSLTEHLTIIGGHVGYGIAYKFRGQGYGEIQLHMALKYIKEHMPWLTRVLITCEEHNIASEKVMISNGGIYGETNIDEQNQAKPVIKKYWFKMAPSIISTSRLNLRETSMDDFNDLKEIISDPINMKHYPKPYDDEGVKRWIKWGEGLFSKFGLGLYAVTLKDGTYIGDCGVSLQNIDGENCFEIGYHFKRDYQGQGYATEAAKAVKKYIFTNYAFIDELYSYCNKTNKKSAAVALRNGMTFVKEYFEEKINEQTVVFKITREEFNKEKVK